jgi:hypothetical protein
MLLFEETEVQIKKRGGRGRERARRKAARAAPVCRREGKEKKRVVLLWL